MFKPVQIESVARQSLRGNVSIAPRSAGDLAIWIVAPLPRSMGMTAGPSLKAAGLPAGLIAGYCHTRLYRRLARHVGQPWDPAPCGSAAFCRRPQTDKTAYDGIVDGFGHFRRGIRPEKISSTEMLRARGVEEATQLATSRSWLTRGKGVSPTLDRCTHQYAR